MQFLITYKKNEKEGNDKKKCRYLLLMGIIMMYSY